MLESADNEHERFAWPRENNTMHPGEPVPIIDVFAGPGGLGEGFSALRDASGRRSFRLALSVEKDPIACKTLRLRAVQRYLSDCGHIDSYHALLRNQISRDEFDSMPIVADAIGAANHEVVNAELGKSDPARLDRRITDALRGASQWVLIGGPPCQAYSLAGRARRTNDEAFESDEKHFLYREYLRLIRVHQPPVFVMENVKGLLSSHHGGSPMFARIRRDLASPAEGVSYEIRSLVKHAPAEGLVPEDYIIESERYGVPQARHRVILLGVRSDLSGQASSLLSAALGPVTVGDVLAGLPPIRSKLSRGDDSFAAWHRAVRSAPAMVKGWGHEGEKRVIAAMRAAARASGELSDVGATFVKQRSTTKGLPREMADWLGAPALGGAIQHEARGHMASDIARYLFASAYAQEFGRSPKLAQFPESLLPDHENTRGASGRPVPFIDRFRVQCAEGPSNTVVSHIAKDGHYYIHYDPRQCRSLTVREAARLQTFPDDYFFEGNKTEQYIQVGNAVPPLLARQIAEVTLDLVSRAATAQVAGKRQRAA